MPRERIRRFSVAYPIGDGNLAAGVDKFIHVVRFRCRLLEVTLSLRTTGGTSGNTDVDVNRDGSSILTAPGLRIAQGAATKHVTAAPAAAAGHPSGLDCAPGQTISGDIDAIPGTASTGGVVTLHFAVTD